MSEITPHLELDVAEALLDRLAAETGACHVAFNRYTRPDGSTFYGVNFHHDRVVKSDHGDTLADALIAARAKAPFDTAQAEAEEAACSCAFGAQGTPVDANCAVHGMPAEAEAA